jgi:predicted nuclease with RNAse H fold
MLFTYAGQIKQDQDHFLGIDLAWKQGNMTGLAEFADKTLVSLSRREYTDNELALIAAKPHMYTSIDGPIVLPNLEGGRDFDSDFMRTPIHGKYFKVFATSRKSMDRFYGGCRGESILQLAGKAAAERIVETFPSAVKHSLFPQLPPHRINSRLTLNQLVDNSIRLLEAVSSAGFIIDIFPEPRAETKKAFKAFEDLLDALLAALNSYFHFKIKSSKVFGEVFTIPWVN